MMQDNTASQKEICALARPEHILASALLDLRETTFQCIVSGLRPAKRWKNMNNYTQKSSYLPARWVRGVFFRSYPRQENLGDISWVFELEYRASRCQQNNTWKVVPIRQACQCEPKFFGLLRWLFLIWHLVQPKLPHRSSLTQLRHLGRY